MPALTNAQKQAAYRARQKAAGLHLVQDWLPADNVDDFREWAEEMRQEYFKNFAAPEAEDE